MRGAEMKESLDADMHRVLREMQVDNGDVYVVGLRESTHPTSWSILFMEADADPGDQDTDMEMDTYCIVVDPGQATWYGGVQECRLDGSRLTLTLNPDAGAALGLSEITVLEILLNHDELAIVQDGLKRVLSSGPPRERPVLVGLVE